MTPNAVQRLQTFSWEAMKEPTEATELLRVVEGFRFVARATDALFAAGTASARLRNVLAAIVDGFADWAAIYVVGTPPAIRLAEIAHRDPEKTAILAEARGQRVFNRESEQVFYAMLSRHRSMLRTGNGLERLRETLQPYVLPLFAQAEPHSMLTVPLYTTETLYGAISVYSTGRDFGSHEQELIEEIGRRVTLAFEHEESVERERRLTQTLQEATLPAQLPRVPGAAVSTVYLPATTSDAQIGGDWYDIFELPNGNFLWSIGDVTGRGLQAAAIMGKLRHSINVIAMYEDDPVRILDAAEKVVQQRYPDALATAFIAIYDPGSHSLRAANAGHPHPLLRMRDGSLTSLACDGLPIGLRSVVEPSPSCSCGLEDVAAIVFYTDGLVESEREIASGEKRLHDAFAGGAIPFVSEPAKLLATSCLSAEAKDDVAILVVSFPSHTWGFTADDARVANEARHSFLLHLVDREVDPTWLRPAEAIFGELVANVVRHAPGPIDIALEWIEGYAVLHVIDRGPGFYYRPRARADVLTDFGRGLWLVEKFGGTIEVERIPFYGTHVRVVLPVRSGASESALAQPLA